MAKIRISIEDLPLLVLTCFGASGASTFVVCVGRGSTLYFPSPAPGFWKGMAGSVNASPAFLTGRAQNSMLHRGGLLLPLDGQLRLLTKLRARGRAVQVPGYVKQEPSSAHRASLLSPAMLRCAGPSVSTFPAPEPRLHGTHRVARDPPHPTTPALTTSRDDLEKPVTEGRFLLTAFSLWARFSSLDYGHEGLIRPPKP